MVEIHHEGGTRMTHRQKGILGYCGVFVLAALSLSILWSGSAYAQEEGPGTVCVLQLAATGEVVAIVVDDTQNVDIAVVVARDNITNLPIRCQDLDRLGVAVANQEPFRVTLTTTIYDNQGVVKCTKGPFSIPPNGGQGVTYKDCV
jgi:hypothetical protein